MTQGPFGRLKVARAAVNTAACPARDALDGAGMPTLAQSAAGGDDRRMVSSSERVSRWLLPATILGSSLGYIDSTVVNVALPAIQQGLDANLATVQWVVNGYLLTLAALILLGGSAGDRYGQRRIFLIGLATFAITSLVCGLAPTASWLIGARLLQGAAAALLTPASLALIGQGYEGSARGPALGIWAAAGAVTTALGPPLGGWLVDSGGWRTFFFINIPLAAVAFLMGLKLPARRSDRTPEPLDVAGAVLAVLWLGLFSYGLIALGEGRSTYGAMAVAVAVPALWAFIVTERRARAPMMPLSMFANRNFSAANALTVLLYASLSGSMFVLPFLLIQVHKYSTAAAGAAFLPFSAIMGIGSKWAGGLMSRIGPRLPLTLGPAIVAAGYVALAFSAGISDFWTGVLPGLCLMSVGMTLAVAPLTTTVFDSAPRDKGGAASGINNAAARAGALLAVAALGLAFGGAGAGELDSDLLQLAYRYVMFGAAVLAMSSAAVAAMVLRRTQER
jgi:EmrB/QacA subfamily drug resistance transporter